MRKDHQIKTYDLDPKGNQKEEQSLQESSPMEAREEADIDLEEKERIIKRYNEEMVYEHEHAIQSNPFMFRVNKSEKCNVHSIEDFKVKVKRKETRTIKEVLRGEEFKLGKRKKIILNAIKAWIKDFKENKSDSVINRLAKTQSEYLNEKPDTFITKAYLRYFGINKEHYNDMERILERSVKEEKRIAYESLNYTIPNDLIGNEEILEKENILIVFGSKEDLNCAKSAIELKNLFKNAKLAEINKGNHLWNIIDYELFNTIIIGTTLSQISIKFYGIKIIGNSFISIFT